MAIDKNEVIDNLDMPNETLSVNMLKDYGTLAMYYQSAIDEVETKLKIIDRELNSDINVGRNNMIHHIESRVKTLRSIISKLERKGLTFSNEVIAKELGDVAGIRVICAYVDDIYLILDSVSRQTDITVLEIKDYIKVPKSSGYRSVHIVLEVPVFFFKETRRLKVEVQFRTIAMDYWASLEHGLKYKHEVADMSLSQRLVTTADLISNLEEEMLAIRQGIEEQ